MNFIKEWKNEKVVSCIIIWFVLLMGMLYRYVEFTKGWDLLLMVLFFYIGFISKQFRTNLLESRGLKIWMAVYIVILLINIAFTRQFDFLFDNLWKLVCTTFIVLLLIGLTKSEEKTFSNVMEKSFLLLNAFWIANLFVLAMQVTGSGFMIKAKWLETNSFYLDQCCGLFGNSGTHQLGFFTVFMLIYNLVYAKKCSKKIHRNGIIIYTFITQAIMLFLSTKNDNIALFVLVPMFAFAFGVCLVQWSDLDKHKKTKIYITAGVSLVAACMILLLLPGIGEFILKNVSFRIKKVFVLNATAIIGSNERLAIPLYGLQNQWGWGLGKGLGAWLWHRGGYLDFPHFGLSSIGSFINLGGIWFYLAQTGLYTLAGYKLCYRKKQKKTGICFLLLTCFIVTAMSVYTNLYTANISTIWILLTFAMFGELKESFEN